MSPRARLTAQEAVLLSLVVFCPLAFGCVETWSLLILKGGVLAFVLLGTEAAPSHPMVTAMLTLGAIGAVQLAGPRPVDGVGGLLPSTASSARTAAELALWVCYACFLWQATAVLARAEGRRRFVIALLAIGVLVSLIGIVQNAHGNLLVYGFRPVRYGRSPFGPFMNRGHAASLLAMSLLAGLGFFLERIRQFRRDSHGISAPEWMFMQIVLAVVLATIFIGLVKTTNRGSLIATAGAVWSAAWYFAGSRQGRGSGLARAFLLVTAIVGVLMLPRLFSALHGSAFSLPYRLMMYEGGLAMLLDFPLWGSGLGTLVGSFHPYKDTAVLGVVDHIHSDWLELLLEAGLLGGVAWLVGLGAVVRQASRELRSLEQAGLLAAFVCFILHCMVEFSFQIPSNALIFLLLAACLWVPDAQGERRKARTWPHRIATLALAATLVPELLSIGSPAPCDTTDAADCRRLAEAAVTLTPHADPGALRQGLSAALAAHRTGPHQPAVRRAVALGLWRLDRKNDSLAFR